MYQSDRSTALMTVFQLTSTHGQLIPYESDQSYPDVTVLNVCQLSLIKDTTVFKLILVSVKRLLHYDSKVIFLRKKKVHNTPMRYWSQDQQSTNLALKKMSFLLKPCVYKCHSVKICKDRRVILVESSRAYV